MIEPRSTRSKGTSRGLAGLACAQRRSFERGELVLRADWPAEASYLIRHGQVRCFLLDQEGRETTTAVLGPGHLVGIGPFVGATVHREFAEALTKVEAWVLPAENVRLSSPATPALQGLALGCLAQRIELALALLRGVSLLSVGERIKDIQLRLTAMLGTTQIVVKRTTLAGLLQIRPETLARAQQPRPSLDQATVQTNARTAIGPGRRPFEAHDLVVDGELQRGCLGLVASGQLQLYLTDAGSRAILVDTLEAGDLFGTGALIGLPPAGLRLVGTSVGAIEVLAAGAVLDRLASSPEICSVLLTRCARRLERIEQGLALASLPDVRERLIHVLREVSASEGLARSNGPRVIPSGWSHVALARHIGVCRETVTRGLATLAKAGVIGREGRRIVLLAADEAGAGAPIEHRKPQVHQLVEHSPALSVGPSLTLRRAEHVQDQTPSNHYIGAARQARPSATVDRRMAHPAIKSEAASSRATPATQPPIPSREISRSGGPATAPADRARTSRGAADRGLEARTTHGHPPRQGKCRLCGLRASGALCGGCAERLELELEQNQAQACPDCGRHQELCQLMPCTASGSGQSKNSQESSILWLRIDSIEEPPLPRNSRRSYQEGSIRELAASLRREGFLQPLCVRPKGSQYELVFGVRRLRAARQAGLQEVPCTVRIADDDRAFLLNALENLHREQLSNAERVGAIERLAATGLGVREISRRTGFNPSTISRWLRINGRAELKEALENDRIDIARAVILVEAPATGLEKLIEQAPTVSAAELRRQVAWLRREGRGAQVELDGRRHLIQALRSLRAVASTNDDDLIQSIRLELERLAPDHLP